MQKPHDDSKACLTAFIQDSTLTVVIEMGLASWLVAGMIPGVNRDPLKKIAPNPEVLLQLLHRWRDEAIKAGKEITRIAVAYETGRDGFWLARWLRARGIDAHVIHATSVAISREHRRAKTDRIDTAMLRRGFLGWLRGEPGHCSMAIVPTVKEEDAKHPHRERETLIKQRTSTVTPGGGCSAERCHSVAQTAKLPNGSVHAQTSMTSSERGKKRSTHASSCSMSSGTPRSPYGPSIETGG
jgi:transposase